MRTIDSSLLTAFVRVAETRSFTAAAKLLGLPKSSVSRAVAQLEHQLGAALLRRTTRVVQVTEVGAAFYQRVAKALAALEGAAAEVSQTHAAVSGTVRITAPADIGQWLLGPIVGSLVRRYPELRIQVVLGARVVDLITEGIDLALRAGQLHDSALIGRRLFEMEGALFASPDYLKRNGTPRSIAALANHRCVVFGAGNPSVVWTLHGPKGIETVQVTGTIVADDYSFLHQAVLAGVGIGLLPTQFAAGHGRGGRLVRVLARHRLRGPPLHLVYPSSRNPPRRVELVREAIIDALRA